MPNHEHIKRKILKDATLLRNKCQARKIIWCKLLSWLPLQSSVWQLSLQELDCPDQTICICPSCPLSVVCWSRRHNVVLVPNLYRLHKAEPRSSCFNCSCSCPLSGPPKYACVDHFHSGSSSYPTRAHRPWYQKIIPFQPSGKSLEHTFVIEVMQIPRTTLIRHSKHTHTHTHIT
jgi:hypothetical protein